MTDQPQFFYCYSKRVSDFLAKQNIKFITVAKDLRSERIFSQYLITDELQNALDKYKGK